MGVSLGTIYDQTEDFDAEAQNENLSRDKRHTPQQAQRQLTEEELEYLRETSPQVEDILDIATPVGDGRDMEAFSQQLGDREELQRYVAPIREAQIIGGKRPTEESVLSRAEDIRDVVERPLFQGGQRMGPISGAATLGLKRTLYTIGTDVLDGLSGVANMATDGRWAEWLGKKGHRDKLEKYKNDLMDRGVGETSAAFSSIIKMWQDAPEFDEPDEFIQKYVNSLGKDKDLYISKREADQITQYFGKGTGVAEKIVRAAPEAALLIRGGAMLALRGSKRIVNDLQDIVDNVYQGGFKNFNKKIDGYKAGDKSLFDVDTDVYAFALDHWATETARKGWFRFFGVSKRMRTNMHARRANRVMDNAKIPQRMAERNSKIADARKKIDLAEGVATINPRASRQIVANQNKQIKQLERGYLGSKEIKDIKTTELFSQAAGITVGTYMGQEYSWLGYLGGGITSGLGLDFARRTTERVGENLKDFVDGLTVPISQLSDEQREYIAKTGKLPTGIKFDREGRKHLEGFVEIIRSLPEDQRKAVFEDIKFFEQLRTRLVEKGIDRKLLDTTIAQASGIVPLMMIRESISAAKLDASKGLSKVAENMADVIEAEKFAADQIKAFEEMVEELSRQANDLGVVDQQFIKFRNGIRNMGALAKEDLGKTTIQFNELVDTAVGMLATDDLVKRLDKDTMIRLVREITRHKFLQGTTEGAFTLANIRSAELETLATRVLDEATARIKNQDTALGELSRVSDELADRRDPAYKIASRLSKRFAVRRQVANSKFEALDNILDAGGNPVRINITKWLTDLYATEDQDTYKIIIPKLANTKILQILTKTSLKDRGILEAFSNATAKESIDNFLKLDGTLEFRQRIVNMIKEINAETGSLKPVISKNFGESIGVGDVDKTVVKQVYRHLFGDNVDLTDFDLFRIIDAEAAAMNLASRPVIEVGVNDIQKISSSLSKTSRNMFSREETLASAKYGNLSKTLLDQIDNADMGDEARALINDAKDYYLNAIVNVFYDTNQIAHQVTRTRATSASREKTFDILVDSFEKPPEEWLEDGFSGAIKDVAKARIFIDRLTKSFGNYNPETGKHELTERGKKELSDVLTTLIEKDLKNEDILRKAITDSDFSGPRPAYGESLDVPLGSAEKVSRTLKVERFLEGEVKLKRAIRSEPIKFDGRAIRYLAGQGFINLDDISKRQTSIQQYLGKKGTLDRTRKSIDSEVKIKAAAIKKAASLQEKALDTILERTPRLSKELAEANNQDVVYEALINRPTGDELLLDLLDMNNADNLSKQLGVDRDTTKALISDIVVNGLLRKTRGRTQAPVRAGETTEIYDWTELATELTRNGERLRSAVGDEVFDGIQDFTNFMLIATRTSADRISDLKASVRLPAGLSIESYISRAYSISRGIISPKYVATEVAILAFRKGKANALAEILKDPEAVDAVILLLEEGAEQLTQRQHGKLFTSLITALANAPDEEGREKIGADVDRQMNQLMQ